MIWMRVAAPATLIAATCGVMLASTATTVPTVAAATATVATARSHRADVDGDGRLDSVRTTRVRDRLIVSVVTAPRREVGGPH